MKPKFTMILMLLALGVQLLNAQQKTVSGTVSDENGLPLPGATVIRAGTSSGTSTDFDGNYQLSANVGDVLEISYVGYATQSITVGASSTYNVSMALDNTLDEVVVTALGIQRDKKSLGYAQQGVGGDDIADVKSTNIMDALSGEVSGLDIQSYNQMGGSANIVVRGYSSLMGNNQALIVVDGTPIINESGSTSSQKSGRGGYSYGNGAIDINPDDVADVSVLKGAAATALYGSRASNGVILITTKTGKATGDGLGISFNSSFMAGTADKETLPKYQKGYGGGYGPFYGGPGYRWNTDHPTYNSANPTENLTILTGEDASYGAAFDPNLNVYHWFNLIPGWGNYNQTSPYVAPNSTANDFLENSNTYINSLSFGKSNDNTTFRLGYTNMKQQGILPNSEIKRNTFSFNGSQKFGDKLTANGSITYTKTEGLGRYGTGYDGRNPFQSFRQWWQVNVDINQQKQVFDETGQNYSWNMFGPGYSDPLQPHYFDNPYWDRYHNYTTDDKNRYFGNAGLDYAITDELSLLGRWAFDTYNEVQEERVDIGAVDVSEYRMRNNNISEMNYDLILSYNKDLNEKLNLDALVGWNLRIQKRDIFAGNTNGGLNIPGIFNFDNSKNFLTPQDTFNFDATKKVDGFYARASFGYDNTYYLEGTFRTDRSSALPKNNNRYNYPSISGSIIFSKLIDAEWLNFGKVRANYAQVGNDLDPYNVFEYYNIGASFGGASAASNPSALNNTDLKAETTTEQEVGIEFQLFDRRLGFDLSLYNRTTDELLTPLDVSNASGFSSVWLNGGSVENKGVEIFMNATPIRTEDFTWDIKVNFAQNKSKVLSLAEGLEFLQQASVQGGVTIGARVGEPYGVIRGKDFIYHNNGGKEIYTAADAPSSSWIGVYKRTTASNNIIGDINPDWTGGVKNSFRYKNLDLSFWKL
ncbi:MAG: SusC/RagA family TonB-linked outer membrane protein [Bacteroidia bacterium]